MGNPLFNRLVDLLMPPHQFDTPHPPEGEAAEFERWIARDAENGSGSGSSTEADMPAHGGAWPAGLRSSFAPGTDRGNG